MTYALPDNTTTLYTDYYVWANATTDNILGYGLCLMVFAMVYFGTMRYGATSAHATLVALATTTMVCGALTIMKVTSPWTFGVLTLLLIGSYIWTYHN